MIGCLDDNEASEFASGSLARDAATRIERHLAACRDCRSLVAALAPAPGDDGADSDVITSPRRVALGKRGKAHELASAPTEPRQVRPRTDPVIAAGDTIGRYIILARLGAGGMGVVFTAYDPQLDRKVALKLLRTGGGVAEAEARSRLIREAQAIAQLSHPNVVAVHDVGTATTGEVYIAMELVEGETMTSWLGHWDRSWRDILELFFQAGRGLAAAHARGLVHRDFKPDNVLVGSDGRVRVTDFGLARSLIDQVDELARDRPRPDLEALRVTLTATGTVLGTPRYMAPEQLRGADADARSDQFSFCVALYEALYERHPLPGDSVFEIVQHGTEAAPPPDGSKVPPSIGRALARGLAADPNKRFPTLAALLVELTPPPVHPRRRAWVAALAGIGLVGAGAATAMVAQQKLEESAQVETMRRRIDNLEAEKAALAQKIDEILYADGGMVEKRAQLQQLQQELEAKDEEIRALQAKLEAVIDAAPAARPRPRVDAGPPPPRGLDDAALLAGVARQEARVESCMNEWLERHPDGGATILVAVRIAETGTVASTSARGLEGDPASGCVKNAIGDATFAAVRAITQAEVTVVVEAGQVRVSTRKTGATAPGQTIDLDLP